MRILIIDSDEETVEQYKELLSQYNECEYADYSFQGIEMFTDHIKKFTWFDVVMIDYEQADIPGIHTVKLLRLLEDFKALNEANVCNIVVSVKEASEAVVKECVKAGCNGLVIKPVTKERLFKSLAKFGIKVYF
jgi:CheY-like chemotaxis protein